METKQLQDLLNERAAKRLDKDLRDISTTITANRILAATETPMPNLTYEIRPAKGDQPAAVKTVAAYWMFKETSAYMTAVRAFWLPKYIQEETEAFMKKVDELDVAVQELKNAIPEEY